MRAKYKVIQCRRLVALEQPGRDGIGLSLEGAKALLVSLAHAVAEYEVAVAVEIAREKLRGRWVMFLRGTTGA